MKLYLIHAGYYDHKNIGGLYEQHTNFFVAFNQVFFLESDYFEKRIVLV